jgi:Zn-dependent peptidase ImmA (M78 family)
MPTTLLPPDHELVKLYHRDVSDKEIAKEYGVTVQAVNKRLSKLGLFRKPISKQVNEALATRWSIWAPKEGTGHHNRYSAKALKVWLRRRLGDDTLSKAQLLLAERWERRLREHNEVLCYDPDTVDGWYYRPRTPQDGNRVIDWPKAIPFPDERFRRALELPPTSNN